MKSKEKEPLNPIQESIQQEMELYEGQNVPFPRPQNLVEQIANHQYVIDDLTFKMNQLLAKINYERAWVGKEETFDKI